MSRVPLHKPCLKQKMWFKLPRENWVWTWDESILCRSESFLTPCNDLQSYLESLLSLMWILSLMFLLMLCVQAEGFKQLKYKGHIKHTLPACVGSIITRNKTKRPLWKSHRNCCVYVFQSKSRTFHFATRPTAQTLFRGTVTGRNYN